MDADPVARAQGNVQQMLWGHLMVTTIALGLGTMVAAQIVVHDAGRYSPALGYEVPLLADLAAAVQNVHRALAPDGRPWRTAPASCTASRSPGRAAAPAAEPCGVAGAPPRCFAARDSSG